MSRKSDGRRPSEDRTCDRRPHAVNFLCVQNRIHKTLKKKCPHFLLCKVYPNIRLNQKGARPHGIKSLERNGIRTRREDVYFSIAQKYYVVAYKVRSHSSFERFRPGHRAFVVGGCPDKLAQVAYFFFGQPFRKRAL